MRIEEENNQQKVDITDLYFQFKTKWRNVFIYRLGEQDFIYRALGRKEYKDICTDTRFNDIEKEDIICDQCLLYPQDFDFENCDAGIPTELVKNILKNSYLDSVSSRTQVLDYYRADMYDWSKRSDCFDLSFRNDRCNHSGIRDRGLHGTAFPGAVLGLQPYAAESEGLYLSPGFTWLGCVFCASYAGDPCTD